MRPQLALLTFNNGLALSLVLLALILGLRWYHQSALLALQQQQDALSHTLSQKATLVNGLREQLNLRGQDPELVDKVDQLQQALVQKQALLNAVQGREPLKNQGFAGLMQDLSRVDSSEVWLSHITVDQQDVRFIGLAADSQSVPKWVESLGNSAYFKGRQFAATRLYREDDQLHFVLSSKLSDLSEKEVASE